MKTQPTIEEIRSTIDKEILAGLEGDEEPVITRRKPKRTSTWFSNWWGTPAMEDLDPKSSSEEEKEEDEIAIDEERDIYRGIGYKYVFNFHCY